MFLVQLTHFVQQPLPIYLDILNKFAVKTGDILLTSWIVLSGFFDDIFKNRSWAWQNFPVFLSNFFLCSFTPPMRSFRKFSNGTTIWSCACANWKSRGWQGLVDVNGDRLILVVCTVSLHLYLANIFSNRQFNNDNTKFS